MKSQSILWVVWAIVSFSIPAQSAHCESVSLPISIDLPLLRSLIVQQVYLGPGETATVIDEPGGCNRIFLSSPQIGVDQDFLRFQTAVRLKMGSKFGDYCLAPLEWEGIVVIQQRPRINKQWQLSFEILDSSLFGKDDKPLQLAGLVFDQVKGYLYPYLQQITINLAPPVGELKSFLLPMFDNEHQGSASRFLASMRPQQPVISDEGLRIDVLAEVETGDVVEESQVEPMASPEALAKIMELWQTWDSLLIYLISQLSDQPLTGDEQTILMDTLLTVRYQFEEVLREERLTSNFIRGQFVWSWQQMENVFRRHLAASSSNNLLGYLAFFTATDALVTLDNVGPAIGIEISRDGFHRLAEMISSESAVQFQETPEVNRLLRKMFGLGEPLEIQMPEDEPDQVDPVEDGPPTFMYRIPEGWRIWELLGCSQAWAGSFKVPDLKEIRGWTAETTVNDVLLKKVNKVLEEATEKHSGNLKLPVAERKWFRGMMTATAWQESCFRQFHIKEDKVTYLLSYNQTSVGLMQINERIWRGIYDREQLRWNIRYNAQAGAEILTLYLNKYIHKEKAPVKLGSASGKRFLAAWLYALYNGGPSQLKKFPKRHLKKQLYQSEEFFLAKYDQAQEKGWASQVTCLPTN